MGLWLKVNGHESMVDFFRAKNCFMVKDILNITSRHELLNSGRRQAEVDKLFDQYEDFMRLQPSATMNKKTRVLKWIKGHESLSCAADIVLSPNKSVSFGSDASNDVRVFGSRIPLHHFEIKYHKQALTMINLNMKEQESCGLYKKLLPEESWSLRPGDAFRIGTLEFVVERFNTGIVSDIGGR